MGVVPFSRRIHLPVNFGPATVQASCIGAARHRKGTIRREFEWSSACSKTVLEGSSIFDFARLIFF